MRLHSMARFPTVPRAPSNASVTLWEATAPVKLSGGRCPGARPGSRLGMASGRGGIPTTAPRGPGVPDRSLPPILCEPLASPAPTCSEALWGLSV